MIPQNAQEFPQFMDCSLLNDKFCSGQMGNYLDPMNHPALGLMKMKYWSSYFAFVIVLTSKLFFIFMIVGDKRTATKDTSARRRVSCVIHVYTH
jgi:hypothetical protein